MFWRLGGHLWFENRVGGCIDGEFGEMDVLGVSLSSMPWIFELWH